MKKLLLFLFSFILLGCATGSYSLSSGKSDVGNVSFVSAKELLLNVTIDNQTYSVSSVKTKEWQKARRIKQTSRNTIELQVGRHSVLVISGGERILNRTIFVSAGEHKIIEL